MGFAAFEEPAGEANIGFGGDPRFKGLRDFLADGGNLVQPGNFKAFQGGLGSGCQILKRRLGGRRHELGTPFAIRMWPRRVSL